MNFRRNLLPALSLALAGAAVAAYPASDGRGYGLCASAGGVAGAAVVLDGGLTLAGVARNVRTERGGHFLAFAEPAFTVGRAADVFRTGDERSADKWGFALVRPAVATPNKPAAKPAVAAVRAPLWSVAAALLLPPLARLRSILRDVRRRRSGRCVACGYDLRGSPGRCPECGAAAA